MSRKATRGAVSALAGAAASVGLAGQAEASGIPVPITEQDANEWRLTRAEAEERISPAALEYYVKAYGVGPAEARRRLASQAMVPNLHVPLVERLKAGLTGVWFDNHRGEWVVQLDGGTPSAGAAEVLDRLGLGDVFRVEHVDYSRAALLRAQTLLVERVRDDAHASVAIVPTGIEVRVQDDVASATRVRLGAEVAVVMKETGVPVALRNTPAREVSPDPEVVCSRPNCDHLVAGQEWGPAGCTLSWKGTRNNAYLFFTAGHCVDTIGDPWWARQWPSNSVVYAGSEVGSYYGNGPGGDAAILDLSANSWTAESGYWNWTPSTRSPLRAWLTQSAAVGYVTCHNGRVNGTACGTVASNSWSFPQGGAWISNMLQINGTCTGPGDSGGPWSGGYEEVAVGIHNGGAGTCPAVTAAAEPIHRAVGWFGATPVTTP